MTGDENTPIRLLLVEDHEAARQVLTERLGSEPDINVVAAVETCAEAIERTRQLSPTIAVVDVQLPDGNGIDLCDQISAISPDTRCIIHTSSELRAEHSERSSAVAVVLKQVASNELLNTIRTVANDHPQH